MEQTTALEKAAGELNYLCASNKPLGDIKNLLTQWMDPTSPNHLQSDALYSFNNTNALRLACMNDSIDVVKLLLETGLDPNPMAVSFAVARLRETRNKDLLQLLIDFGWNVNNPINDQTPPLTR
jgi:hypothetical protein